MTARMTTLDSGLRVVTDAMPGLATVSLGVWIGVGTRHEPAAINGVAHLLEHMAFKGTERRDARRIAEEIEAVGGYLNAYTSRENTAYYVKLLAEDIALGVDILADILQHSVFDPVELDRERTVILQEIGQALDTPDDWIFDLFQERAYPGQALGRPVLGEAEIIRGIHRDTVAGYMAAHYAADDMVVAAAGAVDHDRLVEEVARAFAGLPRHGAADTEAGRYAGGECRQRKPLEQIHLVLGFPGVSLTDPDHYTVALLSTLLGGGMSSRLFQEIREKRGLVYSIYSFAAGYHDGGLFGIYAGTGAKEIRELVPVLCGELASGLDDVTDAELSRARAQMRSGLLMGLENTSTRAEHHATHCLTHGRPLTEQEIVAKIEAVTVADLTRVARRLFAAPPTLAALGPIARLESLDRIRQRLIM